MDPSILIPRYGHQDLRKASYVNDPFNIAQNDNMVSVNTAIQIDLTGQVCSKSFGSLQFSGTGGAFDFAYGAYHKCKNCFVKSKNNVG